MNPGASARLIRLLHLAQDEAARVWREYCGAAQRGAFERCAELDREFAAINLHVRVLESSIPH